jgi:hypothetical protein
VEVAGRRLHSLQIPDIPADHLWLHVEMHAVSRLSLPVSPIKPSSRMSPIVAHLVSVGGMEVFQADFIGDVLIRKRKSFFVPTLGSFTNMSLLDQIPASLSSR